MALPRGAIRGACSHSLLLLVLGLSLLLLPLSDALTPYQRLVRAVRIANRNARVCKGQTAGCLGAASTYTLKEDVVLQGPLPSLAFSAHLVLTGSCPSTKTGYRCIVDAQYKFPSFNFTSSGFPPPQGAPALLELSNLIFQKANGGVVSDVFAAVVATNVTFRNNINGVLRGGLAYPSQRYTGCRFENNNGTVISFGAGKFGLSFNGTGVTVKSSVFVGNQGDPSTIPLAAGTVYLSGSGNSTFEDVQFINNVTPGSGGAVYATETSVFFRGVSFIKNKALGGGGGAVAGDSGFYGALSVSFCSCSFKGNSASNATAQNLLLQATRYPDVTPSDVTASFCNTPIPPGSIIEKPPVGKVNIGQGRKCSKKYCYP